MKKILLLTALACLVGGYGVIHGQAPSCQEDCRNKKTRCDITCVATDAGNKECEKKCDAELAKCLASCQNVKPDNTKSDDDDADYDNDDDDNDDDSDIDKDPDKDDFFKEKKK